MQDTWLKSFVNYYERLKIMIETVVLMMNL